jgi:hypothetical protein
MTNVNFTARQHQIFSELSTKRVTANNCPPNTFKHLFFFLFPFFLGFFSSFFFISVYLFLPFAVFFSYKFSFFLSSVILRLMAASVSPLSNVYLCLYTFYVTRKTGLTHNKEKGGKTRGSLWPPFQHVEAIKR